MRGCTCPPDDCAVKVRGYLAGDREMGDDLVRKFNPIVRSIARRALGADARRDEEDACQVAFLKVFAGLKTWEERCPFCDWLAVVATRRIVDFAQACKSAPTVVGLPIDVVDPHPAPFPPEVIDCLEQRLSGLPTEWLRAYDLARQGERREMIADRLGKSVRTIHYWLAAIREELHDCLRR